MAPLSLDQQAANIAREARTLAANAPWDPHRTDRSTIRELAQCVQTLAEIVAVLAIDKDES